MVNFIESVFFIYIFIGLYMSSLMLFLFLKNKNKLFINPDGKLEAVSIIVPCYNAEKNILQTLNSLLNLDYPKNLIEIIIVDDKSTDNTQRIVKNYIKNHKNMKLIINKKNSGGAAEPTNFGIMVAKYDYIAVVDDDSSPEKDALKKMIGFLQQDDKTVAVTCSILSKKPQKFWQKLQEIEYMIIAWNRKLLDFIDSVYVTPGPFALYKKNILIEIGMFDKKNMTQDIEIVWRLLSHGYMARMCLDARVYSETPKKFKTWWRQRIRWNIGGQQCLLKYKHLVFRKGMLGNFIIPFFSTSLFLGLFGLGLFTYLIIRRIMVSYLSTKYSVYAGTTILTLKDLNFNPTILNFFGFSLFFISIFITIISLSIMGRGEFKFTKIKNILNILFYLIIYLTIYPLIMISSLYKLSRKKYSW